MKVLNRHHLRGKAWPDNAKYIGRGTALGNPFTIDNDAGMDRRASITSYRRWLAERISERDPVMVTALAGLCDDSALVCSCAPEPCHGDVIVEEWRRWSQQDMPCQQTHRYAGIGSRKTPPTVMSLMRRIAQRLDVRGYTLLSGGAVGADSAFAQGATRKEEYLAPYRNANTPLPFFDEALAIAKELHPVFEMLSAPARELMARNSYQILGGTLREPVDFVVCWTPDGAQSESERSRRTGGTGQAIALASRWRIPVFNLAAPEALRRIAQHLERARMFFDT